VEKKLVDVMYKWWMPMNDDCNFPSATPVRAFGEHYNSEYVIIISIDVVLYCLDRSPDKG
jgi:hypothetical protein